jgi:hypothetical protein
MGVVADINVSLSSRARTRRDRDFGWVGLINQGHIDTAEGYAHTLPCSRLFDLIKLIKDRLLIAQYPYRFQLFQASLTVLTKVFICSASEDTKANAIGSH